MRQAIRSPSVHARAIVAALLALGLVAAIATLAWAAPSAPVITGPTRPTNDSTPSFEFTVDPGATADCSIDPGVAEYAPCTSPYTAPELADGDYVFHVRATDENQEQTDASFAFTIDTEDPEVDVTAGPTGPTNVRTPSFGFTAEPDASLECSVDQGVADWRPCTSATTHTATELPDGAWTFRVRATDAAGNTEDDERSFSVDTVPPTVGVTSGPNGPTNDDTPSFEFTAEPGATLQCSVDQGATDYGPCTTATSHTATELADGAWTFRVQATDAAGNSAGDARSFSIDATPPSLSIDSGPAGPTSDATPTFGFTAEAGATVECSIEEGFPDYEPCTSPHTPAESLPDGDYVFRVRAFDALGNQTRDSQSFSVDSAAPSLTIDSGPAGPTNDTTPSFGFTAAPGATVECSIDGTSDYGPCTTTTSHTAATLAEGRHTFRVRATDGVGNEAIVARAFTIDTVPPSLSIGFGPSGTTSDTTPLFGFAAEARATAACSIDQGTPAFGPCTSASSHGAVAPLPDGAYVFRVRATDGAGNQTTATRAFTVDTAPPTPGPETPRSDPTPPPTPPVTRTPPVARTPTPPRLLSPFPLVRISGTLTATGARIRVLSVRAPSGTLVRVAVSPACAGRPSSRRCRDLHASGTVGRSGVIGFRGLTRAFRGGTVIVVRAWRAERIGKYTRFTIMRGKAPRRVDQCLVPGATRGSRCPSA